MGMPKKRNRDKRVKITMTIAPSLLMSLEERCKAENRNRSNMMSEMVREGLAQRGVVGYDG
jgi:metal-responsive CopG/Arc/MetJ family transcriptional regulator